MLLNLLYMALLAAASPMVLYRMIRQGRYRRGVAQKLLGLSGKDAARLLGQNNTPCIWIHAVSVGEVNLLPRLVEQIHQEIPGTPLVISSSTDTGYDLAVKHFGQDSVFFCPLDFTWAVKRTLRHLQPGQLILTELELWPNLIRTASDQDVLVKVINGRLSSGSSANYQKAGRVTRGLFKRLDWVGCQDEAARSRFEACGVPADCLEVTGSMKFDNAPRDRDIPEVQELVQWSGVDPWHRVWVVGSTQEGEEAMAISIYQRLREQIPELRLIVVPRHAERFDAVAQQIKQAGLVAHRRSQRESLFSKSWTAETVILVDTIGELCHWWGVGHIATVGGCFGDRGGQNMLEPAGYGLAVSFGPNTKNFAAIAKRLLDADGAVRVADSVELERFVRRCCGHVPSADALGKAAQQVVESHRGAMTKTVAGVLHHGDEELPENQTIRLWKAA